VNLLEKQLKIIYFKDVRFPWVTLYLITAVGLTPGDSSKVHIYTQSIHRTT